MYKYQNVSNDRLTITASGDIRPRIVRPGEEMLSDVPIENPNFKYLGEVQASGKVTGTQVEQPNKVIDAQKIEPKEGEQ